MRKNKTINQDDLAVDALLAATCRTGALDADVSAKEAENLGKTALPLTRQDQAAFRAQGGDLITALRKRLDASERRGGVGFIQMTREPVYAAGADQERGASRSGNELRRARKRMKEFLGE